jgi:AraC-like DNA-binding protein
MSNGLLRANVAARLSRVPEILRRIDDLDAPVREVPNLGHVRFQNRTWIIHNLWAQGHQIEQLAKEFGCHRNKLTRLINGYCNDPELKEKLAAKLGRSVTYVFGNGEV